MKMKMKAYAEGRDWQREEREQMKNVMKMHEKRAPRKTAAK
jgi:hypothetical protein